MNKNNNKSQLFMNSIVCPNCQTRYTQDNPPRKLRNCAHNLCQSCISTTSKCPLDDKKIEFRRYTMRAFKINQELLQQALNSSNIENSPNSSHHSSVSENKSIRSDNQLPNKTKTKKKTPRQSQEIQQCLLHSKPAELICCNCGTLICSNCALFGEHKGHKIQNYDEFINQLTNFTEQALAVFDEMKEREQNLSEEIVKDYISDCYKTSKDKQLKNIRNTFSKLIEKIRKIQKNAINRLNEEVKTRQQQLLKSTEIQQLEQKKKEWYSEVQALGNTMQQAYRYRDIKKGLSYLDLNKKQNYLIKRGEYLFIEFSSAQNTIKEKIDQQTQSLEAKFNEKLEKQLEQYCYFHAPTQQNDLQFKINLNKDQETKRNSRLQLQVDKESEDDILLEPLDIQHDHPQTLSNSSISPINEKLHQDSRVFKISEVPITHSIHHEEREQRGNQSARSNKSQYRSRCISTIMNATTYNTNTSSIKKPNILAPSLQDNITKKKPSSKKIEIPEKFKQAFEDLKHDRAEVIDFNGAELGDQNIRGILEYVQKSKKLRNLKLVRNKLSDQCIQDLLSACYMSKVISLNLGQNSLTQRTLQMFESYDMGDLRNITLSLNKINRRNVKERLEQLAKRGITMSI